MNGGVNTIVAGELAKAAFQHGFERYGVDILQRIMDLVKQHNGDLPVAYTPTGKVDEGIPDNWGQAAVYSALIEGLAGIVDKGAQFSSVEISPRWLAAGKDSAAVTIGYGPTGKTMGYSYLHDKAKKSIQLLINGNTGNCTARILLLPAVNTAKAMLDGKPVLSAVENRNGSFYLVIKDIKTPLINLQVLY